MTSIYSDTQPTSATLRAHIALRRGLGAVLLAASAMAVVTAGIGYYAQRDAQMLWQAVDGVVAARSVELRAGTTQRGDTYFVRDQYHAQWGGASVVCQWDDPLGSGVRSWVEHTLTERGALWPVDAPVHLRIDPHQLNHCQPADAWPRVIRPRLMVAVAVAALLLLAGSWLRRGTDLRE